MLKAIAQLRSVSDPQRGHLPHSAHLARVNPFSVIVGTSAGAVNATGLAAGAENFQDAVARMVYMWENIHAHQVYRTDSFSLVSTGARWVSALSLGWLLTKWSQAPPKSLLDSTPLAGLLERMIDFPALERALASGRVKALAVTVSSYSSGQHVTYYQASRAIEPWARSRRLAVAEPIRIDHLLASSSLPFVFPAQALMLRGKKEYFGDGAMRQLAPISPAIHLGAQKVLVAGVGRLHEPEPSALLPEPAYPSLAQIAGHALSSIFLDSLAVDIERLLRINKTLALLPRSARDKVPLRQVDVLVISPSQRLDEIAGRHVHDLPLSIRSLLQGIGATEAGGAALASYLLFESGYTRELIDLGFADTMAHKAEVLQFLA